MAQRIIDGYDTVLDALMTWGRSGLIPNTKVVKSYYPPVQDPVTGIRVLMPATVYVTGDLGDRSKIKHSDIDAMPNSPLAGSNVQYAVPPDGPSLPIEQNLAALGLQTRFVGTTILDNQRDPGYVDVNPPDRPGVPLAEGGKPNARVMGVDGPVYSPSQLAPTPGQVVRAARNAIRGDQFKKLASDHDDQEKYSQALTNIIEKTIADRVCSNVSYTPALITDNLDDARTLFGSQDENPQPGVNYETYGTRTDLEIHTTGIPCAMPGVLNCYLVSKYDKASTYPTFKYHPKVARMYDVPQYYKDYRAQYGTSDNDATEPYLVRDDFDPNFLIDAASEYGKE